MAEGFIIVVALLLALLVVGGGLFLYVRGNQEDTTTLVAPTTSPEGGDEEGQTEPTDSDDSDTDNSDPDETNASEPEEGASGGLGAVCPADSDPIICELVAFVEEARGRPFKEFPGITLAESDEFAELLLTDFDEDEAELDAYGDTLRSLGLADADADIAALYKGLLEIGVVGFYDPEIGDLVVRGGEFNLYSQSVLVHELVHAHDDQWIGLDRPQLEDAEDESGAGFLAVQEGNAERITELWRNSLSSADQAAVDQQGFELFEPEDIQRLLSLPEFLVSNLNWPYIDGRALAKEIYVNGGEDAIDEAFENPPRSSEQIVHPELYLSGEAVPLTPIPEYDGELIDEGVFGELGFRFWFDVGVGEGWGTDHYVTYREDDGSVCTRIDVFADNERELDEYREALTEWSNDGRDRSIEEYVGGLRVTGCV